MAEKRFCPYCHTFVDLVDGQTTCPSCDTENYFDAVIQIPSNRVIECRLSDFPHVLYESIDEEITWRERLRWWFYDRKRQWGRLQARYRGSRLNWRRFFRNARVQRFGEGLVAALTLGLIQPHWRLEYVERLYRRFDAFRNMARSGTKVFYGPLYSTAGKVPENSKDE